MWCVDSLHPLDCSLYTLIGEYPACSRPHYAIVRVSNCNYSMYNESNLQLGLDPERSFVIRLSSRAICHKHFLHAYVRVLNHVLPHRLGSDTPATSCRSRQIRIRTMASEDFLPMFNSQHIRSNHHVGCFFLLRWIGRDPVGDNYREKYRQRVSLRTVKLDRLLLCFVEEDKTLRSAAQGTSVIGINNRVTHSRQRPQDSQASSFRRCGLTEGDCT